MFSNFPQRDRPWSVTTALSYTSFTTRYSTGRSGDHGFRSNHFLGSDSHENDK